MTAYILAPTLLLLPDRRRKADRVGWRDFAAMAALAVPVMAGWLTGIWAWPRELYFFRPIYSVITGAYAFLAVRGLEDVGYKLVWRGGDAKHGLMNFVGFIIPGIPLGLTLGFIHPHAALFAPFPARVFGESFLVPGWVTLAGNFAKLPGQEPVWPSGRPARKDAGPLRPARCIAHFRRLTPPPCSRTELAIRRAGVARRCVLRERLPRAPAHSGVRAHPRLGGYSVAFLVLEG